ARGKVLAARGEAEAQALVEPGAVAAVLLARGQVSVLHDLALPARAHEGRGLEVGGGGEGPAGLGPGVPRGRCREARSLGGQAFGFGRRVGGGCGQNDAPRARRGQGDEDLRYGGESWSRGTRGGLLSLEEGEHYADVVTRAAALAETRAGTKAAGPCRPPAWPPPTGSATATAWPGRSCRRAAAGKRPRGRPASRAGGRPRGSARA